MQIDFDQLKGLLEIVSQNDISELTVESGEERITVKKTPGHHAPEFSPAPPVMAQGSIPPHMLSPDALSVPPSEPVSTSSAALLPEPPEVHDGIKITSPMVGTFYRSPSPDKPPFVEVGDTIATGQTICIIEAMKLMNDLPSEVSGRIVEILAASGATVEYGQPLFLVDPNV
jgi:acetyl-CoA carboxylase biotin carboxyl carrier protein